MFVLCIDACVSEYIHGMVVLSMADLHRSFSGSAKSGNSSSSSKKSEKAVTTDTHCGWYVVELPSDGSTESGANRNKSADNSDKLPLAAKRGSNAGTNTPGVVAGRYKASQPSVQPKENIAAPQMHIMVTVLTM